MDGVQYDADQYQDIDDQTCVERHAQGVDEEEFEHAAYLHDAWHETVQYGYDEQCRYSQCDERTLELRIGILAVIIYQCDRWEAEQVEQVHTDRKPSEVANQDDPTV